MIIYICSDCDEEKNSYFDGCATHPLDGSHFCDSCNDDREYQRQLRAEMGA